MFDILSKGSADSYAMRKHGTHMTSGEYPDDQFPITYSLKDLGYALDLADKKIDDTRVVVCGAGTVGLGCARLLAALDPESRSRPDLLYVQARVAMKRGRFTEARELLQELALLF